MSDNTQILFSKIIATLIPFTAAVWFDNYIQIFLLAYALVGIAFILLSCLPSQVEEFRKNKIQVRSICFLLFWMGGLWTDMFWKLSFEELD